VLRQLGQQARLFSRAGGACRGCGEWTALDRFGLAGEVRCPSCGGEAFDLDVTVFAKEKVSFGATNALLLLAGQLSINVRDAIEERFVEAHAPRAWLQELLGLGRGARLAALLEFLDERELGRLAQGGGPTPAYTRSPDEDRLRLIALVLIGLAGLSLLTGGALAAGSLSQGRLGSLPLALGILLCNLAVATNGVLFLRGGARKHALWLGGLACFPVVGPAILLGLPLGLYALKLARDVQAAGGFEPAGDWRQAGSD